MQNATLYWIKGHAPELSSLRGHALFRLTKIGIYKTYISKGPMIDQHESGQYISIAT
jgi:hypothetical protein